LDIFIFYLVIISRIAECDMRVGSKVSVKHARGKAFVLFLVLATYVSLTTGDSLIPTASISVVGQGTISIASALEGDIFLNDVKVSQLSTSLATLLAENSQIEADNANIKAALKNLAAQVSALVTSQSTTTGVTTSFTSAPPSSSTATAAIQNTTITSTTTTAASTTTTTSMSTCALSQAAQILPKAFTTFATFTTVPTPISAHCA
jgi:hypothetical protein